MNQMQEIENRKRMTKQRIREEEMRDEVKLKSQLNQLREQYLRETAPKSVYSKSRHSTPNQVLNTTPD